MHVFLNFEKLGVYTIREEADNQLIKLIKNAPIDLTEFKDYLIWKGGRVA